LAGKQKNKHRYLKIGLVSDSGMRIKQKKKNEQMAIKNTGLRVKRSQNTELPH
jgi:hypothetical protein